MTTDLRAPSRTTRRAFSVVELLMILFIIGLLISILLPSLSRSRELAKRAVCASQQRGIGNGMYIYSNDNQEWFPQHYFTAVPKDADPTQPHKVRWVGMMGTTETLSITEKTTPEKSPDASHPSRSLFLLIIGGQLTVGQFVCPSTFDTEDTLRNFGPDADGGVAPANPDVSHFDFQGYDRLSYGYQLAYGRRGRPRVAMDARAALVAEKGPYYAAGEPGVAGTQTLRDARSAQAAPVLSGTDAELLAQLNSSDRWRAYNSRNHGGEGQVVLFADGHADFRKTPFTGVNMDNIYTIQGEPRSQEELRSVAGGRVPGADERLGPRMNTDSFLVP